jgi:hypothetical protein
MMEIIPNTIGIKFSTLLPGCSGPDYDVSYSGINSAGNWRERPVFFPYLQRKNRETKGIKKNGKIRAYAEI